MSESEELAPGTVLARKFRVVRSLGAGGMGAVYEIEHEFTKHRRALKLLHSFMAMNKGAVERFVREASAAGRIGNPHIVETFDAGTLDSGEPYLVMELLKGQPLSSRLAAGRAAVAEVVEIVSQACGAIAAAHAAGIVHRDLKPDNLFLTQVDGRLFVKILDFGISKFEVRPGEGLALTQEGAALGTPYYMSPEQITGSKDLDGRTDTYALGIILYEALAGVRPFDAETLPALAVLIHQAKPKPLSEIRPDLPAGLAEVVHRAMAGDRGQRFSSVSDLAAALAPFHDAPVAASLRPSALPLLAEVPTGVVPATAPARSLATSASGISMRAASAPPMRSKAWLVGVAASLGVAGLGAWWMGRAPASSSAAAESASAPQAAIASGQPLPAVPVPAAPPPVIASAAPEPPPASSASALPAPGRPQPRNQPLTAPAKPAAAAAPVAAPPAPPAPAAPAAEAKPTRSQQRGLAEENPFR